MKIYASILPFILLALWPSCESDAVVNDMAKPGRSNCPTELMCTYEYVTISVFIADASGKAVNLDSYTSQNLETGKVFQLDSNEFDEENFRGYYPILTDNQMPDVTQEGSSIEFIGYKNGQEVVRETYVIGHNCCHITHISGDLKIQLNKN